MTPEEKRAYGRGYNARNRWPEHRPPCPPNEIVAGLMEAIRKLRDAVDSYLATIDEDDELQDMLGPAIDDVDCAMVKLSRWLKHAEQTDG